MVRGQARSSRRDSRRRCRAGEVGGSRRENLSSSESKVRKVSTDVAVSRLLNWLKAEEDRLVSSQLGLLRCAGMKGGQRVLTSTVAFEVLLPLEIPLVRHSRAKPSKVQSLHRSPRRNRSQRIATVHVLTSLPLDFRRE